MIASRFRILALLTPLALAPLHADVTLRYKMEVKMNPTLPPALAAGAVQGMAALQQESVLRLKGGKGFSTYMGFESIIDFTTQEMTLLDPASKQYSKLKYDQFAEEMGRAMPAMPEQARAAMASFKAEVSPPRATGRTDTIQGVEAEEHEVTISVAGPAMPNMPAGPMIKMVMQFWSPKAGEAMRVPAIRELTGYSAWSYATMNPVASMSKYMNQLPGFAEAFGPLMKELQQGPVLRTHMEMFMPAMVAMLQRMPAANNPFGAGFDANAPFVQMNQELAEFSTAPVPDSVFQIPDGYQEAAASAMIQGLLTKSQAAANPAKQ